MGRHGLWHRTLKELNFFRVHVLAFAFIPLIASGIFYASNGRFHIPYIDALFLCYSSMTVTGLSTVNLSTLTASQQLILFVLMIIGDISIVSWLMVLVRKHHFEYKCELDATWKKRLPNEPIPENIEDEERGLSNPSTVRKHDFTSKETPITVIAATPSPTIINQAQRPHARELDRIHSEHMLDEGNGFTSSPESNTLQLPATDAVSAGCQPFGKDLNQSVTPQLRRRPRAKTTILAPEDRSIKSRDHQYGGFPGPATLTQSVLARAAPSVYKALQRKFTMESSVIVDSKLQFPEDKLDEPVVRRAEDWLHFNGLRVDRNSFFRTDELSHEQLQMIGGAEYRALRLLSYLVPAYFIGTQFISFILFAPQTSVRNTYDSVFQAQPRLVSKPWFSLFQVVSAYTGGGLSLVDLGMLPFQKDYLMIFALMFVILAGNHALPIFLRFTIWVASKFCKEGSSADEALHFLLDHPRRCFIYLFPMHQTWFLFACLLAFSAVEWILFEVLNIGLPAIESIPVGTRILAGVFQGLAARASGFAIVPLANIAPAVQFLYVIMMYIAIYPIAMSIKSTNVYEERSLGVYQPVDDDDEEPDSSELTGSKRERVAKYLDWHLRRQLASDIWWLVIGVFLVCIVERANLLDDNKKWFDVFRVLFELVSAFGGIGLTLGLPTDNFSFVGAMKPLSKLIVCVIMVRGRHRGLPMAVDRAVQLPKRTEFTSFGQRRRRGLSMSRPVHTV